MNPARAATYIVEDPQWILKLTIMAALSAVAFALTLTPMTFLLISIMPEELRGLIPPLPLTDGLVGIESLAGQWGYLAVVFIIGLMVGAILIGYFIDLVRNVRTDKQYPLPQWSRFGKLFMDGLGMIVAYALYLGLMVVGVFSFSYVVRQSDSTTLALIATFTILPVSLLYLLFTMFTTSIMVVPYSQSGDALDFFRLDKMWRMVTNHFALTATWFGFGTASNIGIGVIGQIPVLGLLLSLCVQIPVLGHLTGQYAALMDAADAEAENAD